jgi:hypothetical protein
MERKTAPEQLTGSHGGTTDSLNLKMCPQKLPKLKSKEKKD